MHGDTGIHYNLTFVKSGSPGSIRTSIVFRHALTVRFIANYDTGEYFVASSLEISIQLARPFMLLGTCDSQYESIFVWLDFETLKNLKGLHLQQYSIGALGRSLIYIAPWNGRVLL